jgi:acyl-coenzyme A synthetase/AMP-(fatty) acid ligase
VSALPLLGADAPDLFHAGGERIGSARFLADAVALARRLDHDGAVINLCDDRYAFCVTFAAALIRGKPNLLPPSPLPAVVEAIAADHPGSRRIDDAFVRARGSEHVAAGSVPMIPAAQIAVVVFTSGSTGAPQPHAKTWGSLHGAARVISQRLLARHRRAHIVATVPSQHMYGLETTVLQALACGHAIHCGRPSFPQDVADALAALPAPRVLVTTPVHLRAFNLSAVKLPAVAGVISATAPLPLELARSSEARLSAPVEEIYGCTEAGSIASRRTVDGERWSTLDGMQLVRDHDDVVIGAAHLPARVALQDVIEPEGPDGFRFVCRAADLLKVAGRRASAADLTSKLLSIPGVEDGIVFATGSGGVVERPAALVVAPRLTESEILSTLGRLIDPVFLPRPLRKIDALPRNSVGKLPRELLLQLLEHG